MKSYRQITTFLLFPVTLVLMMSNPLLAETCQQIVQRVCLPRCEGKAPREQFTCRLECRKEVCSEERSFKKLQEVGKDVPDHHSKPWGNVEPKTCNECINKVSKTCTQECEGIANAALPVCKRTCANKYCAPLCVG